MTDRRPALAPRLVACTAAVGLLASACGGGTGGEPGPTPTATPEPTSTTASPVPPQTTPAAEPTPTPTAGGISIRITLVDGGPQGGSRRVRVPQGSPVTLTVTGGGSGTVHVHGYDLHRPLGGDGATVTFTADIPGVFEVEIEETSTTLVELEVR